jgi:nucleotide-binding universal stress UspA family protein
MNILVGFDGSVAACAAVRLAKRHALAWDAKLEIVQLDDQLAKRSCADIAGAKKLLQKVVRDLLQSEEIRFRTRVMIATESAGRELVAYARKYSFDEIIIGIGNQSRFGKLVFGSNAQHIILNAPCPVVTVH